MKVGRFAIAEGWEPFLALDNDLVVPWRKLGSAASGALGAAIARALSSGSNADFCAALPPLAALVAEGGAAEAEAIPMPEAPGPPVIPRNFICIGLNYRDHAIESKAEIPRQPLLFAKTGNALSSHGAAVPLPPLASKVDYEAELAVIIARRCSRVAAGEALRYVAGYTCANDVSARDFQFSDGQWYRGKSCDGFGPIGPWLVTPEEVGDPQKLRIRLHLNGQTMQDSSTSQLIFGIAELVAYISQCITLEAGDVISTGTPPGVGFARTPSVYLKPGDRMEVEIERVGRLSNTVASAAQPAAGTPAVSPG
jgi:2-keto-4-pentenoate hydratase/2-oxohepta-3-ene-1,7-dioic acid hydratase in catechol pathway